MSIEIEKKYRLADGDADRLGKVLTRVGAKFIGREFEENIIFFNTALRRAGSIIRIRKRDRSTVLTYKRRVESDLDIKKQIEYETEISDAEAAEALLGELGLHRQLIYEKYRDTWKLRSVEVVLDELPFGWFMEIEGPLTGIREVEILLDVGDMTVEQETYPRLTARLGKKVGDVIEARFSKPATSA